MSARAKDAAIAACLIAAALMTHAYTRASSHPRTGCTGQTTNSAAPSAHPHIACGFAIAEECRKLDWWPE